jgi:ELWxxDGT repeat protein
MIKDLRPGSGGSSPFTYSQSGGVAYFLSDDGLHLNLWRSDGTEAGTRLVADLTGSFIPSISIAPFGAGGILFTNKQTLWRVDPGIDEAVPVKALANPGGLTVLSGRIFLTADGTEAGTRMLKDVNPFLRTAPSYPEFLGVANGPAGPRLVFDAYDGVHGLQLFATDGTGAGTTPLKPIVSVDTDAATATLNGVLYFDAMDDEHGLELWRSDGTADGTWMVKDLDPGEGFGIFGTPVVYHGRLYFTGSDGGRAGLWTTDGTDADTSILTAMEAQDFVVAGDTLFFEGFGNSYPTLWRTDGTVAGTRVVTDAFLDCCSLMAPFQGTLLVGANDGVHGEEPWLSDGTQEGTRLLKDIAPGGDSTYFWTGPLPGVTEAGGFGYFGADDGIHGIELWRTDGTESGTTMVKDIRPGSASSFPRVLGVLGDTVVIASFTGTLESELWTTDGTEAGTTMLRAYPDVSPYSAVMVDGRILFAETDAEHGRELWRTDGTAAGTVLVQDIAPGPDSSAPQSLQRVGSRILFMADDPIANVEPFAGRAAILAGRPDQGVRDLADEVKAARLPKGVGSALSAKLNAASAALAAGSTTEAILDLEDFVKNVQVQTPRKIDAATAGELIDFAQDLVRMLEGDFNP